MKPYKAVKGQLLTDEHREKRVEFCNKILHVSKTVYKSYFVSGNQFNTLTNYKKVHLK